MGNLGQKSQGCLFRLKIGTHGISSMLILIPTLFFRISNPEFLSGQIWTKKIKAVRFVWKLAHIVSQGCWFLFQYCFSEFPTLNSFLGKFRPKKSNFSVLSKIWHTCYLEDADSYSDNSFLNFQPKTCIWVNSGQENQSCPFCLKIGKHGILRMLILIPTLIF